MADKYREIIDMYFDGELDKAAEVKMFDILSRDDIARNYFREISFVKNSIQTTVEDFPDELEYRIFEQLDPKEEQRKWFGFGSANLVQYAFATVVVVLMFILVYNNMEYNRNLEVKQMQIKYQEQLIRVMNNGLPEIEVFPAPNEIVITTKL